MISRIEQNKRRGLSLMDILEQTRLFLDYYNEYHKGEPCPFSETYTFCQEICVECEIFRKLMKEMEGKDNWNPTTQ